MSISENVNMIKNNYINETVPYYLREEFITEYSICKNHTDCLKNLFKLHIQSVNAWTMIVSNLFVILIIVYVFIKYHFKSLYSFMFLLHLFAHTIHTPFSVGYHTFNSISEDEHIKWRKYDVYGIFFKCIIMSFTLSFFTYDNINYILYNVSLTLMISYYSFLKFRENENNGKPLDTFEQGKIVGLAVLSYNIPFMYKIYNSIQTKTYDITYKLALTNIVSTLIFGLFYVIKFPESFFENGKFNKMGNSHNLMHLGVIISSICETLYIFLMAKQGNLIKTFK